FIRTALVKDQFRPWDLSKPLNRIVLECEKHEDLYEFRDAGVYDKNQEVLAHFETVSDQGSLLESQKTVDAIKAYVLDGGKLKGLAINWLSKKSSLETDLRVLVGAKDDNELLVSAR